MMGKLNELPNELLLEVFEYISCKDLLLNVRLVCSKFASIIYASKLWNLKLKRLNISLPRCQTVEENFDVARCCSAIENERNRWADDRLGKYVSITGHDATVDAIRFVNTSAHRRLCITGARDRSLILWDVDKIAMGDDSENWNIGMITGAHQPNSPYLYSCSADRTVVCADKRMWKSVHDLQLSAYAQSISYCDGQLLCGTTDGNLILIDPNDLTILSKMEVANISHIHQVKLNKGSQMCLMRTPHFNIFTPGLKPSLMARSGTLDAEPARFDYFGGDLAITCGGGSVLFWTK
ncbi:unnamed protein product [Anisakis simplex]|uniref:F-box domain-containing protein n=1 Tax=Anisakis simplex TaxID=6269 RepID=A0A0M3JWU4_ANISI|nr:unnamed protein product [Anisakis simplex]